MEEKIQSLDTKVSSLKEQLRVASEAENVPRQVEGERHSVEAEMQIEEIPIGVKIPVPVMNVEIETPPSDNETRKSVMMNVLSHRISILKRISQDSYNAFINLQSAEQVCKDAIGWLDSIFQ